MPPEVTSLVSNPLCLSLKLRTYRPPLLVPAIQSTAIYDWILRTCASRSLSHSVAEGQRCSSQVSAQRKQAKPP